MITEIIEERPKIEKGNTSSVERTLQVYRKMSGKKIHIIKRKAYMCSKVRGSVRGKNKIQLPSDFSLATSDVESYKLE